MAIGRIEPLPLPRFDAGQASSNIESLERTFTPAKADFEHFSPFIR
jgi:hypothetical protein